MSQDASEWAAVFVVTMTLIVFGLIWLASSEDPRP